MAKVLVSTGIDSLTGAGAPAKALLTPLTAPAVTAPIAPVFSESFRLSPASKELPAPAIKP